MTESIVKVKLLEFLRSAMKIDGSISIKVPDIVKASRPACLMKEEAACARNFVLLAAYFLAQPAFSFIRHAGRDASDNVRHLY